MQLEAILKEFRRGCECEECTAAAMRAIHKSLTPASVDRGAIALDILKIILVDMLRSTDDFFGKQFAERAVGVAYTTADAFVAARVPVGLGASGAIDHFEGVTEGLRQAVAIGEGLLPRYENDDPESHAIEKYVALIQEAIDARG